MSKINVWQIVKDHYSTFRSFATGRVSKWDIVLGLVFPFGIAFMLVITNTINLDNGSIGILATSLSIFAALLFNLLVLLYDIVSRDDPSRNELEKKFLSEVYSNVSFSILISLLAVVLLLVAYYTEGLTNCSVLDTIVDGLVLSFIGVFLHVMLMVLKRVHAILKEILPISD